MISSVDFTISLHDSLPIWLADRLQRLHQPSAAIAVFLVAEGFDDVRGDGAAEAGDERHHRLRQRLRIGRTNRSGEHTSELQSPCNFVCRLMLEIKNKQVNL